MNSVSSGTVEGWVTDALDGKGIGASTSSHIMYVLPTPGVDFGGAAAYAYINWYRSVFRSSSAGTLLVLMHELGHNLKARHSGKDGASCEWSVCCVPHERCKLR